MIVNEFMGIYQHRRDSIFTFISIILVFVSGGKEIIPYGSILLGLIPNSSVKSVLKWDGFLKPT